MVEVGLTARHSNGYALRDCRRRFEGVLLAFRVLLGVW